MVVDQKIERANANVHWSLEFEWLTTNDLYRVSFGTVPLGLALSSRRGFVVRREYKLKQKQKDEGRQEQRHGRAHGEHHPDG